MRDNLVRMFEDKRYDYDGHGRLTEKRSGKHTLQRFEWDDEHRLTAVHTTRMNPAPKARRKGGSGAKADTASPQTTQTTTFEYDALGRRIAKVDAFGRTEFIWEGMRLIEERRGSSVVSYVYEPDSYVPLARIDASGNVTDAGGLGTTDDAPLPANDVGHGGEPGEAENEHAEESARANEPEVDTSSNVYYFHTDQVGLPEELTDAQGHIRWRAAYKAWGNTLAERWETIDLKGETVAFVEDDEQPAIEQNLRYQGQYLDRDTGLHYNTFRYYDPDVGRFISPDPIGLNGGHNLHEYAPNPSGWVDPWGWAGNPANSTHITYVGVKDGKPYVGYASKPGLGHSAQEVLDYRYSKDFSGFDIEPKPIYRGEGQAGKDVARGLEQRTFEERGGLKGTSNKQSPVGPRNARRQTYLDAADAHKTQSQGSKGKGSAC